jgi:hypothetical protein
LPDPDRRLRAYPGEAGFDVTHLDAVSFAAELAEGRPALAIGRNILPVVIADRAMRRRDLAAGMLNPASSADVRLQL